MKLNLKDYPKEWRKSALLVAFGLAVISSLLRWRHGLGQKHWLVVLSILSGIAILAVLRPRWFRPYHLFSMRVGFALSQIIGRIVLFFIFFLVITPMAWLLRLLGKDPLQLKPPTAAQTYWRPAKDASPLDRSF